MAATVENPLNSKLLADILYIIFVEHFQSYREKLKTQPLDTIAPRFVYKDGGLGVTHVCRFWRYVALNYPALWNLIHVPSYHKDQVQEYLIRSGDGPLTLHFTVMHRPSVSLAAQKAYNEKVWEGLRDHLWRVKDLRLSDLGEDSMKDILPSFFSSSQELKSLSLSQYYTTFLSPYGPAPFNTGNLAAISHSRLRSWSWLASSHLLRFSNRIEFQT